MDYAYWKILAWRFIRAGIAGGIGATAAISVVVNPDLKNLLPMITVWGTAFLAGFITGTISAVALALRDWVSDGDKTSLIEKLPL